jgi:nucleoside-diphosphate-sugar epimerase
MIERNFMATVALAQAAVDLGVARLVVTGTCEEYGHRPAPFAEDMAPAPLSPYSASKAASTQWLTMMHATRGLPAVVLRPFLVYGPGQSPPKLVPSALLAALAGRDFPMTSGRQGRELTYVDDVVEGLLRAATAPGVEGQVINLGSGQEYRVVDIVARIFQLTDGAGRPLPGALADRVGEMMHFRADTAKAERLLGWRATTSLDDGLARTLDWAARHGDTPVPMAP